MQVFKTVVRPLFCQTIACLPSAALPPILGAFDAAIREEQLTNQLNQLEQLAAFRNNLGRTRIRELREALQQFMTLSTRGSFKQFRKSTIRHFPQPLCGKSDKRLRNQLEHVSDVKKFLVSIREYLLRMAATTDYIERRSALLMLMAKTLRHVEFQPVEAAAEPVSGIVSVIPPAPMERMVG